MSTEYPLHAAVMDNNLEEVNRLLAQDSTQVNTPDQDGDTPLSLAVGREYYDIACRLVENGAMIEPPMLKEGALHDAAYWNKVEEARFYILAGMDVNATNADGDTPLHIAAFTWEIYGYPENHDSQGDDWKIDIVKLLLQHKAECWCWNNDGILPIWYALFSKNFQSVKLLVEHGAELWSWLLHEACRVHDEDIIEFLLSQGCDINGRYDSDDPDADPITALHTVCQDADIWRAASIAKLLLTRGADVNARDVHGQTPLFRALCDGWEELWQILIEHRGHGKSVAEVVNVQDNDGNTPSHFVLMQNNMERHVDALQWLSPLADINIRNKAGQTPLQLAFSRMEAAGMWRCFRTLLENGHDFDIGFQLADGTTPLIWASKHDKRLAWLMLKKGRPIDADEKMRVQKMFSTFNPDEMFYIQNGFYPNRATASN